MKTMNEHNVKSTLKYNGIRPTQQRVAVYHYLLTHPVHPSADTIYQALSAQYPVFSRTTIYNTLNSLVKADLVRAIKIKSEEQCFDANNKDHGHFYCVKCRNIFDFEFENNTLTSICPTGFSASHGDVYFTGICKNCSERVE